jgi:hypothetical protein
MRLRVGHGEQVVSEDLARQQKIPLSHNSHFVYFITPITSTHTLTYLTMSVTDETKAVAPEAATAPAEAEPTKEVEKAADAAVDEKEEETKVSRRNVHSRRE